MNPTNTAIRKNQTLYRLLEDVLLVPDYQRDYAQGRADRGRIDDIREKFVADLHRALLPGGTPCHLGLVYGARSRSYSGFVAVDGQQRLTTLFLLHGYLLKRTEGDNAAFADELPQRLARFKWAVRPYSSEFIGFLLRLPPGPWPEGALSTYLRQQTGFHDVWLCDPSVQAILRTLDSLHRELRGADAAAFRRRLCGDRCPVSFDCLPLADGTDEFQYLKMNSRGRSLTTYEQFKSKYQERPDVRPNTALKQKMDNAWLSLALALARPEGAGQPFVEPDVVYQNLLNEITLFLIRRNGPEDDHTRAITASKPGQKEKRTDVGFVPFEAYNVLAPACLEPLMDWLCALWPLLQQTLHAPRALHRLGAARLIGMLKAIASDAVTYAHRARFAALLLYREACPDVPAAGRLDPLFRWTRVFFNLINATTVDAKNLTDVIAAMHHAPREGLYDYLLQHAPLRAFNLAQQEEEQAKIRALRQDGTVDEAYEDFITTTEADQRFDATVRVLGFYRRSVPVPLRQMQERLELFDELYADWFLPNRWLFVQALLTFADLPKPFGDVLYLKTWDNPYWKYHNLRTAPHVTPWLNRLLEAAQAAGQPLEAFFRQRVEGWLDGFARRPYAEQNGLYWVYYLLRDRDGEAGRAYEASDYGQVRCINEKYDYCTVWLYRKTYKNEGDMLISNKRHEIIEAVAQCSLPRERTHGKSSFVLPLPGSPLGVRFTPQDIHVGLPADSSLPVPDPLPQGYWSEANWKALKWMPHRGKFFYEGEGETFDAYRDALVARLHDFAREVERELAPPQSPSPTLPRREGA